MLFEEKLSTLLRSEMHVLCLVKPRTKSVKLFLMLIDFCLLFASILQKLQEDLKTNKDAYPFDEVKSLSLSAVLTDL